MTTYTYTGYQDSVTLAGQVFERHTPVDVTEPAVIAAIGTFEPAGDFHEGKPAAKPKAAEPAHKPLTKADPAPKPPPTPNEAVQTQNQNQAEQRERDRVERERLHLPPNPQR